MTPHNVEDRHFSGITQLPAPSLQANNSAHAVDRQDALKTLLPVNTCAPDIMQLSNDDDREQMYTMCS